VSGKSKTFGALQKRVDPAKQFFLHIFIENESPNW